MGPRPGKSENKTGQDERQGREVGELPGAAGEGVRMEGARHRGASPPFMSKHFLSTGPEPGCVQSCEVGPQGARDRNNSLPASDCNPAVPP